MSSYKKIAAMLCSLSVMPFLCGFENQEAGQTYTESEERAYIEETLNLANNTEQEWTYSQEADAWTLSVVSAVAYPELPNQQGVSVCVPGVYVKGIDTDGDGEADILAQDAAKSVKGALVIDHEAQITSTNGQIYTADTAPVILNTGAAGYGSQSNQTAGATYAANGYINVVCGNRGKQDTVTDEEGNTTYTGDAPSCLADQKAAARYVKYNILLGNLPGSVDHFVSTGGSGGGAHATMFAATSNHSDFYDYQIEAGAVGVYKNEDGSYSTTVTVNGEACEISDGAWGCVAYSAITSLYEADMALAFEYYLDSDYSFKTAFQKQLAEYLSESYMEYINGQNLSVEENAVGFDLNGDGDMEDTIALTIAYDPEAYADTNGYYGTYLDLYMAEFTQNLQWYLDNLGYADGWTWFDAEGNALSDEAVAAMTGEEKAQAFIEGRYAKGAQDSKMGGMMGGGFPDGGRMDGEKPQRGMMDGDKMQPGADGNRGGRGMMNGELPDGAGMDGELPDGAGMDGELPDGVGMDGELPDGVGMDGELPDDAGMDGELPDGTTIDEGAAKDMVVGTPEEGTTQSAAGSVDSVNYASYEEMAAEYRADIEEIEAGDRYGNQIVSLYNPLNYIGAEGTEDPTWVRIMMGAAEGDMSMFSSLNLQIAMLNAGIGAEIEWQWDGGHVPSEVLGESLALYVDRMYGEYVEGAVSVSKPEANKQMENGTAESASGTDISAWVSYEDTEAVSFSLKDAAAYRVAGASKAIPGFDAIDYGQEDYVFGSPQKDARHWNPWLLAIFEEHADVLEPLFNQGQE